ncbi:MAG: universal stress protein [Myxococcota bacterium]|nr:universal stress protein [Myxococcota bacterium]
MVSKPQSPQLLLAIDGEPHTDNAVNWALDVAPMKHLHVVAAHVKDPYLKQFHNDMYAQGREAYLAHIDACLEEISQKAVQRFEQAVNGRSIAWRVKMLSGDPVQAFLSEIAAHPYALVVLGRKPKSGAIAKWRSQDLPHKLVRHQVRPPLLIVPGDDPHRSNRSQGDR